MKNNKYCISWLQLYLILIGILLVFGSIYSVSLHSKHGFISRGAEPTPYVMNINNHFINNGQDAAENEFPYYAYYGCGGVLIHPSYVLTVAHCVDGYSKYKPGISIIMGLTKRDNRLSGYFWSPVDSIIIHDKYIKRSTGTGTGYEESYDIALLHLERPASNIPTLSYPPGSTNYQDYLESKYKNTKVTVMGFGTTNLCKLDFPLYLQKGSISIDNYTFKPPSVIFLKDKNTNVSIGYGDSGGPVVMQVNANYYVVGGILERDIDCTKNQSYAVSYSFHSAWIEKMTGVKPLSGSYTGYNVLPVKSDQSNLCTSIIRKELCDRNGSMCAWYGIGKGCLPKGT